MPPCEWKTAMTGTVWWQQLTDCLKKRTRSSFKLSTGTNILPFEASPPNLHTILPSNPPSDSEPKKKRFIPATCASLSDRWSSARIRKRRFGLRNNKKSLQAIRLIEINPLIILTLTNLTTSISSTMRIPSTDRRRTTSEMPKRMSLHLRS